MNSNKKTARLAGILYLIVVLTGIFNLVYTPSQLIVWDDPAITLRNIIEREMLFRFGMFSGFICYLAFLLLPFVLFKLFSPINKTHAILMVTFAVVSVPISFSNMQNKFQILTLLWKANDLAILDPLTLQTQVMFYLRSYNYGNQIASIFWGLWLFPLGFLIYKSRLIPTVLGILLMLGCFGYLINFTGSFLFPNYSKLIFSKYVSLPASIGEICTCLWLLIMGAKDYIEKKNFNRESI